MAMENSDWIASAALLVSLASFGVNAWRAWRDRPAISASCHLSSHPETDEYSCIRIRAVSTGIRPIVLHGIVGQYSDGSIAGEHLEDGEVTLAEGKIFEHAIGKFDGFMVYMRDDGYAEELFDFWLEDTKGERYSIKNSRQSIIEFKKSRHPLGVRTHLPND